MHACSRRAVSTASRLSSWTISTSLSPSLSHPLALAAKAAAAVAPGVSSANQNRFCQTTLLPTMMMTTVVVTNSTHAASINLPLRCRAIGDSQRTRGDTPPAPGAGRGA